MSAENRERADDIAHRNDLTQTATNDIEQALDEAEARGLKEGLETHKAGCMIAFQRGAESMREKAAQMIKDVKKEKHPYTRSGPFLIGRIRSIPTDKESENV